MSLFKQHLYDMAVYSPPLEGRSAQKHLLLDFNERTLAVSDSLVKALCDFIQAGQLQRYPAYGDILQKLADYVGVQADQIMITNGSDQGIDLAIRAAVSSGDQAIIPVPSFAMYEQCARVENAQVIAPAYDIQQGYPRDEVLAAITAETRLIVIALPNNPTGTPVRRDDVEMIIKAAPNAVVLVDECYFEYSGQTVVDLVDQYANLVVVRTFSKTWGLPSLRFGFMVSQAANIEQLVKIRGPYDINQLAIVAAEAALQDPDYTREYVREVMQTAKPMLEDWLRANNMVFWPSSANYLWAFPPKPQALVDYLQTKGILVRAKQNLQGELGVRITVGTVEQTERLIADLVQFYR